MKITYDKRADAAYIKLSDLEPSGVVEVKEGLNIDVTDDNKIIGIEILDASKRMPLSTLFQYEVESDLVTV